MAVDGAGNVYVADPVNNAVRILRPTNHSVLIGAVVDAASQRADPVSPGKIVVIYGAGLGPSTTDPESAEQRPVRYANSAERLFPSTESPRRSCTHRQRRLRPIVPYAISGTTAQVTVAYQGQTPPLSPSLWRSRAEHLHVQSNRRRPGGGHQCSGWDGQHGGESGEDRRIHFALCDGRRPDRAGRRGWQAGGSTPARPVLPVSVTVGGIPATVQYAGGAPGQVAGLMQVNVQIPSGVQPGGYVPVVLQVGDASTTPGAVWIAVSGN